MRQTARHALALAALMLLGGCDEPLDPALRAVLPDRAAPGAPVDIVGERLEGHVQVNMGGLVADLLIQQPRRLRIRVPAATPGLQLLVVTVDGRVSNPLSFTVDTAQ